MSWVRGEDDVLYRQLPPQLGKAHITELMGRHPFHPYNPALPAGHPCTAANQAFFKCMTERDESEELFMKHVNCYHPHKTALMKCTADQVRAAKKAAAAAAAGAAASTSENTKAE